MKSLLVDAIRAANNPEQTETDGSAALDRSLAPEEASNDAADDVEAPSPETDGLELMETGAVLDLSGIGELVSPDEDGGAISSLLEADSVTAAAPATNSDLPVEYDTNDTNVPRIERLGRWSPLVCLLVAVAAGASYTTWHAISGNGQTLDLGAHQRHAGSTTGDGSGRNWSAAASESLSGRVRFPFLEYTTRLSAAPADNTAEVLDEFEPPAEISIEVRERSPAGTTEFDEATFTSLEAAYNAYLAGEIRALDMRNVLTGRAERGGPETETEIKLLIHRHPGSALLHRALGTLLASDSRWPEAQAAFDRAAELDTAGLGR